MTDMDFLLNIDHVLLLTHLIDGYSHAWNTVEKEYQHQHMREKEDREEKPAVCSGDRIMFVNNSSADLFISQLFTDEAVLIPRYVFLEVINCIAI